MKGLSNDSYVKISDDEMEARVYLIPLDVYGEISKDELIDFLNTNGVTTGIIDAEIEKIVREKLYHKEILVAKGVQPLDGIDGEYEYKFKMVHDKRPKINEDGSVNYWSIDLIENVRKNQVIAVYKPAVQGHDGVNVKGKRVQGHRGKELAPLRGRGYSRLDDGVTYVSTMDGKIEYVNDVINISNVYEISGDVDLSVGNVDFRGDVIVHGAVRSGFSIKATGNIIVDGQIEIAQLTAGKDIVLRSGMQGSDKAFVKANGNIFAKFFEHTNVWAGGNIEADILLSSNVYSGGKIILKGKKGIIIGGVVTALSGIETMEIGNTLEVNTSVVTGVDKVLLQKRALLEKTMREYEEQLDKIDSGLARIQKLNIANDPRKVQLLRAKIQLTATIKKAQMDLDAAVTEIEKAAGSSICVYRSLHPGVKLSIDNIIRKIQYEEYAVLYKKQGGELVSFHV